MKYKNEFNWIKELKKDGYKFMIMPKRMQKTFFATKELKRKKNGDFYSTAKFDEFKLENNNLWIPGSDAKGLYIAL